MLHRTKRLRFALLAATFAAAFGAAACDDATVADCTVAADCASGTCRSDGTCAAASDSDAGLGSEVRFGGADSSPRGDSGTDGVTAKADAATAQDTGPATADAAADTAADAAPDAAVPGETSVGGACVPNHDGVVARAEVLLQPGLTATWQAASAVTVDMAGQVQAKGDRLWNLTGPYPGDHPYPVATLAVDKAWYGAQFPGATYAARMSEQTDLLGVFEVTDKALLLRGVVSPTEGLFQTRLTYAPPVQVLAFPLQMGSAWTVKTTVSGTAKGVLVLANTTAEAYTFHVGAHGTLQTAFGAFPVLRLGVVLEQTIGFSTTVKRSFLFVSECYGTVASVDAEDGEKQAEFTKAAQVRRF